MDDRSRGIVTLKPHSKNDTADRELKEARDLVRAAERDLNQLAKRTGTVFIGRAAPRGDPER